MVGVVIESHKRRLLGRAMFRHANACTHPTQHIHTQIPHVHTERKHTHTSPSLPDPPRKRSRPPPVPQWPCPACTTLHPGGVPICSVCGARMLAARALSAVVDMGDGGGWGLKSHFMGCSCRGMVKRRVGRKPPEGEKGGGKGGVKEGAAFQHAMCVCNLWAEVFVAGERWAMADPLRGAVDCPDMMRVMLHVANANGCPRTFEALHQDVTRVRFIGSLQMYAYPVLFILFLNVYMLGVLTRVGVNIGCQVCFLL